MTTITKKGLWKLDRVNQYWAMLRVEGQEIAVRKLYWYERIIHPKTWGPRTFKGIKKTVSKN